LFRCLYYTFPVGSILSQISLRKNEITLSSLSLPAVSVSPSGRPDTSAAGTLVQGRALYLSISWPREALILPERLISS
jgi:hypothetical protein